MSLTPNAAGYSANGSRCYHCGQEVRDPAIEWLGTSDWDQHAAKIYLHPVCAVEFCLRVLRDVHEWECKTYSQLLARQVWGSRV